MKYTFHFCWECYFIYVYQLFAKSQGRTSLIPNSKQGGGYKLREIQLCNRELLDDCRWKGKYEEWNAYLRVDSWKNRQSPPAVLLSKLLDFNWPWPWWVWNTSVCFSLICMRVSPPAATWVSSPQSAARCSQNGSTAVQQYTYTVASLPAEISNATITIGLSQRARYSARSHIWITTRNNINLSMHVK